MKKLQLYYLATAELVILCAICVALVAVDVTADRRAANAVLQSVQEAVIEASEQQAALRTEQADSAAAETAAESDPADGSTTIAASSGDETGLEGTEAAASTGSAAYETDVAGDSFYLCPVDFEALQEINPDIYAWIYIPGTDINYPVLQSSTDDEYYLTHNADGDYDSDGAVFSQATYNGTDFTDPVTILYGHRRNNGTIFSELQRLYQDEDGLETYSDIIIYLPDRELHYTPFAAVPYDATHILYTYDFSDASVYTAFLATISSITESTAQFLDGTAVSTDDNLLILSTCLYGNAQRRYLILAKEVSDIEATAALSVVN